MSFQRLILSLFSALALTGLAAADDISGHWSVSIQYPSGCTLTGVAQLTPTDDPTRYSGQFTATQICDDQAHFVVEQSLRVRLMGRQVSILSTIENFIRKDAPEGRATYRPDNFSMMIKPDGSMFGSLNGRFAARWTRSQAGIS